MGIRTTGRGVGQAFANRQAATNSNGQLYTDGTVIWSYGPHWPIAMWVKHANGDTVLYVNSDRYSVTTSKHRSFAMSGVTMDDYNGREEVDCDTLKAMVREAKA